MTIFNIDKQLQALYQAIEDNDGELTFEMEEALAITENDFRNKIKDYSEVVKQISYDIDSIDKELIRLQDLKKAKQRTLENLKKIMVYYIDKYGDINANGVRYIDYGTGKISTRKSKSISVDDNLVKSVTDTVFYYLNYLNDNNQLSCYDGVKQEDLFHHIKQTLEEDSDLKNAAETFTFSDIEDIKTNISFDIPLDKLLSGDGFKLVSSLLQYCRDFKVKESVNKQELKKNIDAGIFSSLGQVVENKTLQIK